MEYSIGMLFNNSKAAYRFKLYCRQCNQVKIKKYTHSFRIDAKITDYAQR